MAAAHESWIAACIAIWSCAEISRALTNAAGSASGSPPRARTASGRDPRPDSRASSRPGRASCGYRTVNRPARSRSRHCRRRRERAGRPGRRDREQVVGCRPSVRIAPRKLPGRREAMPRPAALRVGTAEGASSRPPAPRSTREGGIAHRAGQLGASAWPRRAASAAGRAGSAALSPAEAEADPLLVRRLRRLLRQRSHRRRQHSCRAS